MLIAPGSPEALTDGFAAAMNHLLRFPADAARLGADGRRRVEEHFDWDKKIDQMLAVYNAAFASEVPA